MPKLKYTKIEKFLSDNIHPTFPLVIFILFCFVILQALIRSITILSPFTGYIYVVLIALTAMRNNPRLYIRKRKPAEKRT